MLLYIYIYDKVPSFFTHKKNLYGVKKSANETRFNKKDIYGGEFCKKE